MHFACLSMPQEAPRMAARLGAASGPVICMFSWFWHPFFAFALKNMKSPILFKPAHVLQRFEFLSIGVLICWTVVFYDLGFF